MFWSKTKDVVHAYVNRNKGCFVTMEDTLLGSVLDMNMFKAWCGEEGSNGKAENRVTTKAEALQGSS